jgi:hypothetical protein
MKHKMLRIEPRLAFINGVLLANRVLIFRFQLLAVYVLLVHSCGECRIVRLYDSVGNRALTTILGRRTVIKAT